MQWEFFHSRLVCKLDHLPILRDFVLSTRTTGKGQRKPESSLRNQEVTACSRGEFRTSLHEGRSNESRWGAVTSL